MENRAARGGRRRARRAAETSGGGGGGGRRGRPHNRGEPRLGDPAGDPPPPGGGGGAPLHGEQGDGRGGRGGRGPGGGRHGGDAEQERLHLGGPAGDPHGGAPRNGEESIGSGGGGGGRLDGDAERQRLRLGGPAGLPWDRRDADDGTAGGGQSPASEPQARRHDGGQANPSGSGDVGGDSRGKQNGDRLGGPIGKLGQSGDDHAVGRRRRVALGRLDTEAHLAVVGKGVPDGKKRNGGRGRDLRGAGATAKHLAAGTVEMKNLGAKGKAPSALLPWRTFLSDALLRWTVADVINENLYKDMVQNIPHTYDSSSQFCELQSMLLLEEQRAVISSSIYNRSQTKVQYCQLLSVERCDSSGGYYLDVDLEATRSGDIKCQHIAKDGDICLLSSRSPLGNLDIASTHLAIVVGVGRDTLYQRSFRVVVLDSETFEPEKIKFVNFLTNITYQMELANILSLGDERANNAVKALMEVQRTVGEKCKICVELPHCEDGLHSESLKSLFLSLRCLHQKHTEILWAPGGTMKGYFGSLKAFQNLRARILICLPSIVSLPDLLIDLKEISYSTMGEFSDVLVLGNISGLQEASMFDEFFLEHQSQKMYCCLAQCKDWMSGMSSLLDLKAYRPHCTEPATCNICSKSRALKFCINSFTKKFDMFNGQVCECLNYLRIHSTTLHLLEQDLAEVEDLLGTMKQLEILLSNKNLRNDLVQAVFELVPNINVASVDSAYNLAESLNEKRQSCVRLLGSLMKSLQLPELENRDDIERFCIKNSRIIVTTFDCSLKLQDLANESFDILMVCGANQMKEVELLLPLFCPVRHVILFGDNLHRQPHVQSKICKEAGYGVSIFQRLQNLVPEKRMLKHQFAMNPLISQFPNYYFHYGNMKDAANVMSHEYNKEFASMKLPLYCLMDIPFMETTSEKKGYINSAATFILLRQFCEDMANATRRFNVGVVCLSSDEANVVRDHLSSKKQIHEMVDLHVISIDSLQEQAFDLVILSMIIKDVTQLKLVNKTDFYVALSSSRHLLWMVGESKALFRCGGICQSLVRDAKGRMCVAPMEADKLSEVINQFQVIDKECCTKSNYSHSGKITPMPGQELTLAERPYKTKYTLPLLRNQRGQSDTCSFQSISGSVESLFKFRNAGLVPPQEFKWNFIMDDWKIQYEEIVSKPFGSEDWTDRGKVRMQTSFGIYKDNGVLASNESGKKGKKFRFRRLKIKSFGMMDPGDTQAMRRRLKNGGGMVIHFRLSRNYFSLKPGEVYVFDPECPIIHPRSDLVAGHAAMAIGIGHEQQITSQHLVIQNSLGKQFGINGIGRVRINETGRVAKKTLRELYWVEVDELKPKPAPVT